MNFIKPIIYTLCTITLLNACKQQSHRYPHKSSSSSRTSILMSSNVNIPDAWIITAKLGIRTETSNGSIIVYWQQQQSNYYIRFTGPLGQGSGVLSGDNTFITIKRANKNTISSHNPIKLIQKSFGLLLPLEHLNYWIRGLPSPFLEVSKTHYNNTGTIASLQQSGWSLVYTNYQMIDTWLLPRRIRAQKKNVILTILIKKWKFPIQSIR